MAAHAGWCPGTTRSAADARRASWVHFIWFWECWACWGLPATSVAHILLVGETRGERSPLRRPPGGWGWQTATGGHILSATCVCKWSLVGHSQYVLTGCRGCFCTRRAEWGTGDSGPHSLKHEHPATSRSLWTPCRVGVWLAGGTWRCGRRWPRVQASMWSACPEPRGLRQVVSSVLFAAELGLAAG